MNIALIGYRGSGKSSIGKALAERLAMPFVDTDDLIVRRAGKSIREIFAEGGEERFRALESAAVEEVMRGSGQVIALGGGAVLRSENAMRIKAGSRVIYLRSDAQTLHQRIMNDPATAQSRPTLTAMAGTLEEVKTLLAAREPRYMALADVVLEVTMVSIGGAVDTIIRMM